MRSFNFWLIDFEKNARFGPIRQVALRLTLFTIFSATTGCFSKLNTNEHTCHLVPRPDGCALHLQDRDPDQNSQRNNYSKTHAIKVLMRSRSGAPV